MGVFEAILYQIALKVILYFLSLSTKVLEGIHVGIFLSYLDSKFVVFQSKMLTSKQNLSIPLTRLYTESWNRNKRFSA